LGRTIGDELSREETTQKLMALSVLIFQGGTIVPKWWKYFWLVSVFLIINSCGGTGENIEQKTSIGSIAVLLPDSSSSMRWEADDRRFFAQAFESAGVDYTIFNAEGNARTQQTQAEQAITHGAGKP
jgi:hypothetical protein